MADRTSAEIFGDLFSELAKDPERYKELALIQWKASHNYDFMPQQMDNWDDLVRLGLAKMQDGDYLYADEDGDFTK